MRHLFDIFFLHFCSHLFFIVIVIESPPLLLYCLRAQLHVFCGPVLHFSSSYYHIIRRSLQWLYNYHIIWILIVWHKSFMIIIIQDHRPRNGLQIYPMIEICFSLLLPGHLKTLKQKKCHITPIAQTAEVMGSRSRTIRFVLTLILIVRAGCGNNTNTVNYTQVYADSILYVIKLKWGHSSLPST